MARLEIHSTDEMEVVGGNYLTFMSALHYKVICFNIGYNSYINELQYADRQINVVNLLKAVASPDFK